ncbi:hypothetical protein [Alteraurantiacibacter palmitatis]|uniref:Uncharacterized protein n=1 Tax=Alteraurantiacibacter palmitatis TaxID=2054628 RepID=A0ABV7E735_9SPHN
MALTDLPDRPWPVAREIEWELVDFGGTLESELGGCDQRVNRLGNRWQVTVPLPAMDMTAAREWSALLVRGLRTGVRWKIIQPGTPTGSPGNVLVAGAGQAGFVLNVDGGTPGYPARRGQFFSILTGGRRFVHQIADPQRIAGDGTAALPVEPAMRVVPADNAVVELGRPYLEGLIRTPRWKLDADQLARGISLTIREAR